MLVVPHWLPFQQQIIFWIAALVWKCLLALDPAYLRDLCWPTPGTRGCSSLHSMERRGPFYPFCPYFHKADPCIPCGWPLCVEWASIGTAIAPQGSFSILQRHAKTVLFRCTRIGRGSEK